MLNSNKQLQVGFGCLFFSFFMVIIVLVLFSILMGC